MKSYSILFVCFVLAINLFAQNNSLRNDTNNYDYVIITIDDYMDQSKNFADHKNSVKNLQTLVTTTNDILKEFDSYPTFQENMSDFISFAGTNWQKPSPKYFLFVGTTLDIPNYEFPSVVGYDGTDTSRSDYFYGLNKFNNESETIEFCIGRVSVQNNTELSNYFNKIIKYENQDEIYLWNKRVLFGADDGKTPSGDDGDIFENIVFELSEILPSDFEKKYVFENHESEYYGDRDSIISFINNYGSSLVYFSGHGNSNIFTHDKLFTIDDVDYLYNINTPFVFSGTFRQYFSNKNITSISDKLLFSKVGSVAAIFPVGDSYLSKIKPIQKNIIQNLFIGRSIGEVFIDALNDSDSNDKIKLNLFGDPSLVIKFDITADVSEPENILPTEFILKQNYPNPFNPNTIISYQLPEGFSGIVSLKIFDITGQEVKTLINKVQSAGRYNIDFDASNLRSGVYFYQLSSNGLLETKKMVLLK